MSSAASTSSTDLWEECYVTNCGRDAKKSLLCACTGPWACYALCSAHSRQCPECGHHVADADVTSVSGAPTDISEFGTSAVSLSVYGMPLSIALGATTYSSTDLWREPFADIDMKFMNYHDLVPGDFCVVKSLCPNPSSGEGSGYLQYRPGDLLRVWYVQRRTEKADWIYAERVVPAIDGTPIQGWLEKAHVSRMPSCPSNAMSAPTTRSHYSAGLSKKLACILRHKAGVLGLTVREEGFVPVGEIMQHVHGSQRKWQETLRESRHADGSLRFETCTINGEPHVRSRQRRSIPSPEVESASLCEDSTVARWPRSAAFLRHLRLLCDLKRDGYLSDSEFQCAKARILD